MFKKILLFSAVIISITSFISLAQDQDTVIVDGDDGTKDTVLINGNEWNNDSWDEDSWSDNFENDWNKDWKNWRDWDFDFFNDFHGKPTISLNYGISKLSLYEYNPDFADPALIEGKLGYTSESSEFNDRIAHYNYKYFRFAKIATNISNKDFAESDIKTNTWRFGFGRDAGYGWRFGESAILPYNSNSFDWSRIEFKNFPYTVSDKGIPDAYTLERYDKTFRFGTSTEAGVKLRLIGGITLEGAYERSIIFERHMFWKWAGSSVIEIACHGLLDNFIEEIGDSSPYAVPVISFVLRNALSYGIYELRKEKMNWPFDSEAPLMYEQFKFGVTFLF